MPRSPTPIVIPAGTVSTGSGSGSSSSSSLRSPAGGGKDGKTTRSCRSSAPDHASTTPPRRASGPCPRKRPAPAPGRATARAEVFAFIKTFYNRRRLRKPKVFGYLTPAETGQRHQHALAAWRSSVRDHGKLHLRGLPVARTSRPFSADLHFRILFDRLVFTGLSEVSPDSYSRSRIR